MIMQPHIRDHQGKRIHMIGIGGSSMSGLAEMLLEKGYIVTGSDSVLSHAVERLRDLGIPVTVGHDPDTVRGADMAVYSAAIAPGNPERAALERLHIPSIERSVLLGQLMEGYPQAVAVSGTHGKTTVTSMLAQTLLECGLSPAIHIGGRLDAVGGSTRLGEHIFVAEACEFHRSFLELHPTVAIVLNIEEDHLDCYKDIDDIERAFGAFLNLLPKDGLAIGWGDDPIVRRRLGALSCRTLTYGLSEACDWRPLNARESATGTFSFTAALRGQPMADVKLTVPGDFNMLNALCTLCAAHALGVDACAAADALTAFKGAHRRFEHTGTVDGVLLYHDYGHNPTEMRNTVRIACKQPHNRVWAVMQPHTYSRVKALFDGYLTCTALADFTLVTDIFAAREQDPGDIHASMIVEGMKKNGVNATLTPTFDDAERTLRAHWQPGDLVLTMGCGNINLLNEQIQAHG